MSVNPQPPTTTPRHTMPHPHHPLHLNVPLEGIRKCESPDCQS
jgi:hypothetical protein